MELLLDDISSQDIDIQTELIQIFGVSPSGKARNEGAKKAQGDIFIFLDSDIRLGQRGTLKNLVSPLISDKAIGVCGAVKLIPEDSSWFQRRCAKEIPHLEHSFVKGILEVGTAAGACCAVRKEAFLRAGEFNDKLIRGVEAEFCSRVKKNQYRICMASQAQFYHPAPKGLLQLIRISIRNGVAVAFADMYYPNLNFDMGLDRITRQLELKSKKYRLCRYIKETVKSVIFFKPFYLISKIVYAIGYFMELIFKPIKNS